MISREQFCGNGKNVNYLNRILDRGRVSHAYLFEGPEYVGKTTLALHFACELLGDSYDNVLKNPDLIFVSADKEARQISVETIRNLQKDLSLYPYKSKYKVALIDKAELMNSTAANALLKTLEEPGKTSVLILVSSDLGKILSTIKSRCQLLNFNIASRSSLEEFIKTRSGGKSAGLEEILYLSEGKPGVAINLLENSEFLDAVKKRKSEILDFAGSGNFKKMEKAGLVYALERGEVVQVLDLWVAALRLELLKDLEKGADISRIRKAKNIIEAIVSVKKDILENNANVRLAIENLCLNF